MHADTIEEHERLMRAAKDLVSTWEGTPPMTDESQVRAALEGDDVEALLPYVVDACREAGLLTDAAEPYDVEKLGVRLWLSYVGQGAPSNAMSARSGLGWTKEEASLNADHWHNQAPFEKFVRVTITNSRAGQMERGRHTARMRFETMAQVDREQLTEGHREALRILDAQDWEGGYASAWMAAYPRPTAKGKVS